MISSALGLFGDGGDEPDWAFGAPPLISESELASSNTRRFVIGVPQRKPIWTSTLGRRAVGSNPGNY